jgi:heat shock protein HslJ
VKPEDLDDRAPIEPGADLLANVHARSHSFRRRRSTQRLASVTTGLVVLALAGGIAWTRIDTTKGRGVRPGPSATSTTTVPSLTQDRVKGKWRPTSITGYFVGPRNTAYFTFDGRGNWTGSDGCNERSGTYRLEATGIRFMSVGSTAVGCGPDAPDFESIETAPRSEIRNDQLTFLTADGSEVARFVRAIVTARIELPSTTMTAGSKMEGRVVVENNTGRVIEATGCGTLFGVMLANDTVHPDPAWPMCAEPLPIPVGESTYPVTIWANYQACSTEPQGTLPVCPAPLPPGDYQARFFQSSQVVIPAPPIDVNVVP